MAIRHEDGGEGVGVCELRAEQRVRGGGGGDGGGGRSAATDAPSGWRPATLRAQNRRTGSQAPSDVVRLDGREHRERGDVVLPSSERGSPVYVILRQPPTDVQLGLCNLGNTCYMSAVLQCLSHTPVLQDYFLGGCWKNEINPTNFMGSGGVMAKEYFELAPSAHEAMAKLFHPREFRGRRRPAHAAVSGLPSAGCRRIFAAASRQAARGSQSVQKKPLTEDKDGRSPGCCRCREYWTNFCCAMTRTSQTYSSGRRNAVTCTNCSSLVFCL